MQIHDTAYS